MGVLSRVHDRQVTQTRRDLFFTDSYALGKRLIPELERVSTRQFNCLFTYAKRCAKYNLKANVKACKEQAKKKRLFGIADRIKLFMTGVYGLARPFIRKVYYRLLKIVKTK